MKILFLSSIRVINSSIPDDIQSISDDGLIQREEAKESSVLIERGENSNSSPNSLVLEKLMGFLNPKFNSLSTISSTGSLASSQCNTIFIDYSKNQENSKNLDFFIEKLCDNCKNELSQHLENISPYLSLKDIENLAFNMPSSSDLGLFLKNCLLILKFISQTNFSESLALKDSMGLNESTINNFRSKILNIFNNKKYSNQVSGDEMEIDCNAQRYFWNILIKLEVFSCFEEINGDQNIILAFLSRFIV